MSKLASLTTKTIYVHGIIIRKWPLGGGLFLFIEVASRARNVNSRACLRDPQATQPPDKRDHLRPTKAT
jgi:hypothetical protein